MRSKLFHLSLLGLIKFSWGGEMPLLISEPKAAKYVGLATRTIKALADLPRVQVGKRRMYRVDDLDRYFRAKTAEQDQQRRADSVSTSATVSEG